MKYQVKASSSASLINMWTLLFNAGFSFDGKRSLVAVLRDNTPEEELHHYPNILIDTGTGQIDASDTRDEDGDYKVITETKFLQTNWGTELTDSMPLAVRLSHGITAEVYKNKIVAGCQTLPKKKVEEIINAWQEMQKR